MTALWGAQLDGRSRTRLAVLHPAHPMAVATPVRQVRAASAKPAVCVRSVSRPCVRWSVGRRSCATSLHVPAALAAPRPPPPALSAPAPAQLLVKQELASMPVSFVAGEGGMSKRRILCYGDSLTVGYCSSGQLFEPYGRALSQQLAAAGVACEVSICGLSGRTAKEMAAAATSTLVDVCGNRGKGLRRALEEDGPFDLVIIMAGTNDMGHGTPLQSILQDIHSLHETCHARCVPTVALAPPPAPGVGAAREALRQSFVGMLRTALQCMRGTVCCVDPADYVPLASPAFWERDGLHFSPLGSRTLGHHLAKLAEGAARFQLSSYLD